jgi:2,5-diketo-D-gluconate reductase A
MDIKSTFRLRTGREIPVIGLGTWQLHNETAVTVARALELGYRMIDTSGDYGTQPGVGRGMRTSGLDRTEIYLVTKVEEDEDSYDATKDRLRELDLEWANLILIHRPPRKGAGKGLWEGLIRASEERLTHDIGVSNYSIEQIQELINATGEVPAVNQIEWSPFGWSQEMLDYCRAQEILIQAYSPVTRTERLDDERLGAIAAECEKSPGQVLLRWDLQLGAVPLPKANREDHLKENLDVFDFELSGDQMKVLNDLNEEWSALGHSLLYS